MRQRPIPPDDAAAYSSTCVLKLAIAEIPVLVGFVLGLTFGPGWLALIGFTFTASGLVLAWPSEADRERHELLYLV